MIEYRDGSFGEIKPLIEALKDVEATPDLIRALHVGTEEELKARKSLEERVKTLEEKLSKEATTLLTSDILHIPSKKEMRRIIDLENFS